MLSRAAERVGLEWRPPPCPEPSRLDDWFLGVVCAGSQHPAPVPLFPEVHGELTGCGWHILLPETDQEWAAVGSSGRFESVIKGPTHAPSAKLWKPGKCCTAHLDPLWSDTGRVPAFSPRCPTAGTSVVPAGPACTVSGCLEKALPSSSRWLLWTIWLGYAIQFARHSPRFHLTAVKACVGRSLSYWRGTWWSRSLQPIWRQGFTALTSLCPRKAVGGDQSWICASWTGQASVQETHAEVHLRVHPSPRLACSDWPEGRVFPCLNPSAPQAIPAVCVWRTGILVQGPALRAVPVTPCLHESCGGSPGSPERTGHSHSQLPRRLGLSLRTSCANTGTWCSRTSASWAFGSTGKRANSPRCRGSLFSVWNWIRSIRQHASRRNVLSRCWTAWRHSRGRSAVHWNNSEAPGAYGSCGGKWRRWGCFIWDRFNTGSMASPEVGCGNAALTGPSHTACRQTLHPWSDLSFLWQECPWNRSLGMLWFTRMPPPPAGRHVQRACSVGGLDGAPNCTGT